MPTDTLDVDKQQIGGGAGVNSPTSGVYGEKAAGSALKKSLPQSQAPAPGAAPGAPPMVNQEPISPAPTRGGRPLAGAPGVPPALTAPSAMPDVPVNTPLLTPGLGPQVAPVENHFEDRLRVLDMLAQSQRVSSETRAWAQNARALLAGGDPA